MVADVCGRHSGKERRATASFGGKGVRLLTEQQIGRSWHKLLTKHELDDQTMAKAKALLDGLRPESPLRHRLQAELDELRKRKLQKQN